MIRSQSEKLSFRKYMAAQCVYLCFYCLGNLGQTITKHNVSVLAVVEMIGPSDLLIRDHHKFN